MYSIQTCEPLVLESTFVSAERLLAHEEVVVDRSDALATYLQTLRPYCIVPSVLVCAESDVIIDGHHRFHALRQLGFDRIPVTYINYRNAQIVTDIGPGISKDEIIRAGVERRLLPPKSSFHHVADYRGELYPLILLSVLFRMKFTDPSDVANT